ncbi:MAG TPA: hypothetical protein VMU17_02615, partial [Elusimicrobiota bacterium]|nr:hypothetical protein [Elusimicrobiota bacterium]
MGRWARRSVVTLAFAVIAYLYQVQDRPELLCNLVNADVIRIAALTAATNQPQYFSQDFLLSRPQLYRFY